MSHTCDECDRYLHDKEEFKFLFKEADGDKEPNSSYETTMCLCLDCFNNKFSVPRYAKLCSKHPKEDFICCSCELEINPKRENHYYITCFNSKVFLNLFYCSSCYINDVG